MNKLAVLAAPLVLGQSTGPLSGHTKVAGYVAARITNGTYSAAVTNATPASDAYGLVVRCIGCTGGEAGPGGGLTNDELRASPVPVSGTFYQATQPVSLSSLPALVAGNANIGDVDVASMPAVSLSQIGTANDVDAVCTQGGTWTLGANSGVDIGDVTLNNASIAVTGTFWQATQPVSGPITDAQLRASAVPVSTPTPITAGTHANAWNAATTGAAGSSNAIDIQFAAHVTAFGNVSGATTMELRASQDGTNYYTIASVTTTGASDFAFNYTVGARYVRLRSSASVTATATIAAKG